MQKEGFVELAATEGLVASSCEASTGCIPSHMPSRRKGRAVIHWLSPTHSDNSNPSP